MERQPGIGQPLDVIAARARSGDREAEEVFFESLRVRFLAVAKRRVRTDLEDVVQDSLRVIHAKYRETGSQVRILTWAMVVLRNVIGNYYQKRRMLDRGEPFEDRVHAAKVAGSPTRSPLENSEGPGESTQRVLAAIGILARRHPRCGLLFRRILERLAEGGSQRDISGAASDQLERDLDGLSRNALYVALHRCRNRLRGIMREIDGARTPERTVGDA